MTIPYSLFTSQTEGSFSRSCRRPSQTHGSKHRLPPHLLGSRTVAHNHAQLNKKLGTTEGQALQTFSFNWELGGSSGHQGQHWSSDWMSFDASELGFLLMNLPSDGLFSGCIEAG
jgi:hypothetical protein